MELKPGYKQTELGVIPEDWDPKNIGGFVTLKRGHDLTWRDPRDGDIPIMGSAGPNEFHDTALAKGPGVVLGRSGASFGQAHYCELDFWPHNTALYVTDFKDDDPLFVYYLFSSIDFSSHNSGGAQQSLNRNFIAPIGIGVPSPEEQGRLAKALSDVDELIKTLEELISKKRNLKQAAMQELLTGKRRLPGFEGEWEEVQLGDIAAIRNA
jgi:type I restriction enzyme S subunit